MTSRFNQDMIIFLLHFVYFRLIFIMIDKLDLVLTIFLSHNYAFFCDICIFNVKAFLQMGLLV